MWPKFQSVVLKDNNFCSLNDTDYYGKIVDCVDEIIDHSVER